LKLNCKTHPRGTEDAEESKKSENGTSIFAWSIRGRLII